jgi:hypothetical protein
MFVRWKKRALRRRGSGSVLYAVLVESHRVDGKVRQKVVRQEIEWKLAATVP